MPQRFEKSLTQNKLLLKDLFGDATDFYTKDIQIGGVACCICMFEGLSSIERLWVMMLDTLSHPGQNIPQNDPQALYEYLMKQSAIPLEHKNVLTLEDARAQLTAGTTVILVDGLDRGLVLSTQMMQFCSVSEPSGENNVRGSREGFCDLLRINISLIRRLVRTDGLMVQTMTFGERTQTEAALLYDRNLVDPALLDLVKRRLSEMEIPFLFDSGYFSAFLQKSRFSFFQSVGYTERPDTGAAKICEGKMILLVNGSPFALIVPYFFNENFQSMDDYSEKAYFSSMIRVLKYAAFLIAVMLPGLFVSVANFTPEFLPSALLYKTAAAESATPLPLFAEAIFVNFLLEIVREAGLRLPRAIGHSVSLVAALILGDAAVSAGLLGTPVVVVAALTAICTYVVPNLYEPVTVLRLLFIAAGGILGPIGIIALFLYLIFNLCSMNAFGIPFTAPMAPASRAFLRDGVIRKSWRVLARSAFTIQDLQQTEVEE